MISFVSVNLQTSEFTQNKKTNLPSEYFGGKLISYFQELPHNTAKELTHLCIELTAAFKLLFTLLQRLGTFVLQNREQVKMSKNLKHMQVKENLRSILDKVPL